MIQTSQAYDVTHIQLCNNFKHSKPGGLKRPQILKPDPGYDITRNCFVLFKRIFLSFAVCHCLLNEHDNDDDESVLEKLVFTCATQ